MSNNDSQVVLHHLDNSRSQRILWLLEELEVEYEIAQHKRINMLAPRSLRDVHPLGKAPVIQHKGRTLAESGAIIEYLVKEFGQGRFVAQGEQNELDELYFKHYAEGTFMPLSVWKLILTVVPSRLPFFIRPIASIVTSGIISAVNDPQLKNNLAFIEEHLSKQPTGWFAGGDKNGGPTVADFLMSFNLETLVHGDRADSIGGTGDATKRFVQQVQSRPAYKRALEKGGKYGYADNE